MNVKFVDSFPMKFISIVLLVCVSCVCNAQLLDYGFPFPYIACPDSFSKMKIHKIVIEEWEFSGEAKDTVKPYGIYTFKLNSAGRLLRVSSINGWLSNIPPKIKRNKKKEITEMETVTSHKYFFYDSLGRIKKATQPDMEWSGDSAIGESEYFYTAEGQLDYMVFTMKFIHSQKEGQSNDTVLTSPFFLKAIYEDGRIAKILSGLSDVSDTTPHAIYFYSYIDERKWKVEYRSVEKNELLILWKISLD